MLPCLPLAAAEFSPSSFLREAGALADGRHESMDESGEMGMNWTRNQWLEFLTSERMSRLNEKRRKHGLAPLDREAAATRYSAAHPQITAGIIALLS